MTDQPSSVDIAYATLRDRAIRFDFKPGERINESALTRELQVSRTPLREALNRLVAEGFLTLAAGQGFFCRPLSPDRILELYELRCALECEALRLGVARASDDAIAAFVADLDRTETAYATETDLPALLDMDEAFHMGLAGLCGNDEILRLLRNVNERIRYVRLINLRQVQAAQATGLGAHRIIADAVQARDTDAAVRALRQHIERRREETIELVRLAYSELYVPG